MELKKIIIGAAPATFLLTEAALPSEIKWLENSPTMLNRSSFVRLSRRLRPRLFSRLISILGRLVESCKCRYKVVKHRLLSIDSEMGFKKQ